MRRPGNQSNARDARLQRLADRIDALAEKDEKLVRYSRDMAALREAAAVELHAICREFVNSVNRLLSRGELTLDPAEFLRERFVEEGANLFQIGIRGRILQIEFAATAELVSTEEFRVPYTLSGSVRAFNQELLDQDLIEEQLLFYTIEHEKKMWRFFDARTYRSGAFDREYLIGVMEQLI
ncbi:MAG TPA: hypothetical protein VLW65_01130 [Bryobacteraceae bacterium]|nr:hypothetical protein [Bryobacteraceae bacterium]